MAEASNRINLGEVCWRNDGLASRYVAEHHETLTYPKAMSARELAEAHTYCVGIDNPYAAELCRRADLLEAFERMTSEKGKDIILRAAAEEFGVRLF